MMKKILGLLALVFMTLAFTPDASAYSLTRTRFRASGCASWATGSYHTDNVDYNIVNNPAYTYTLYMNWHTGITYGSLLTLDRRPDNCHGGQELYGYVWREGSDDGGVHWALIPGTFTYVYMASGMREVQWFLWQDDVPLLEGLMTYPCPF